MVYESPISLYHANTQKYETFQLIELEDVVVLIGNHTNYLHVIITLYTFSETTFLNIFQDLLSWSTIPEQF